MPERVKHQPRPHILGQTEIIRGRRTRFELFLAGPTNRTLPIGDHRLEGLVGLDVWKTDNDKIFFYSPFDEGILVCDVKKERHLGIKINDGSQVFTAYTVGSNADSWFNGILKTPDLKVVARPIPNP